MKEACWGTSCQMYKFTVPLTEKIVKLSNLLLYKNENECCYV